MQNAGTLPNRPSKRKLGKMAQREELAFWLFILPWLIGFIVFSAGPIVASMGISLTEYSILQPPVFIGLENYKQLFNDELF